MNDRYYSLANENNLHVLGCVPRNIDQSSSHLTKLLMSSMLGTILEWYDFSIFAYLTPILSTLFFPKQNASAALIATYSIFAVGFLVRPLGAAFFGHYGDRFGRRKMLVVSLVLISIATTCMGLLPTYQQIGMLAPILLTMLRLIQGFCVGGETTGAISFILESNPKKYRGALGALVWSAVGIGMLLGSFVAMLVLNMHADHLQQWGWRIPFMLGILAGLVGYYIRRNMPESVLFKRAEKSGQLLRSPLLTTLRQYKKQIAQVASLYVLSAMITYLIFVFMPAYASQHFGVSLAEASVITTIAMACVTLFVPVTGWLSDYVGRKPCLLFAASGFAIFSYPLYLFVTTHPSYSHFVIVESCFVLLAILYQGVITATVQEIPATPVRFSVAALGYNFSYSIFGGTAPLVATYLVYLTGSIAAPGLYLAAGGLAAILAIWSLSESSRKSM